MRPSLKPGSVQRVWGSAGQETTLESLRYLSWKPFISLAVPSSMSMLTTSVSLLNRPISLFHCSSPEKVSLASPGMTS